MNSEPVKVKLSVLRLIYDSALPIYYKLNSCLEDVLSKRVIIGAPDRALLLEFCAHASTLKIVFESYFEDIEQKDAVLELPQEEYLSILAMAKSVDLATRTSFGNISLRDN